MQGYIFTSEGQDALACFGTQGVRYCAEMADGSGLVAFDADDHIGEGSAIVGGWIMWVMEPHPDYPPSWPASPKGPKRQTPTGDESFAIYAASDRSRLPVPRAAAWVTDGTKLYLLVEDGPDYAPSCEAIWRSDVTNYLDVRLASVS